MLPFTYEMFDVYHSYKQNQYKQNQYKNYEFDYNFAIAQLTDESTESDYAEINYLKECMNNLITPYELNLINDYKTILQ